MLTPTAMAITGSSHPQPLTHTSAIPTNTPAEVHTSVIRCLPSALSVMEWWRFPALISTSATAPLSTEAATEIINPIPTDSRGCGERSRWSARTTMEIAATKIITPSTAAEKYSALVWPKLWLASAGLAATFSTINATMAATRFTRDSAASANSPTDPVTTQAPAFSRMVARAVATASQP